jgi:hypothetical protein
VNFLRVRLGFPALQFGFTRVRHAGLMHPPVPLFFFSSSTAFQSIIDNMTLSETEITE